MGLITGGGGWVAPQVGNLLLRQAAQEALRLAGGGGGGSRRRRRGIISPHKGVAYAQPPPQSVWPDLIVVNGTKYMEEDVGSPVYKSEDGAVLDFTNSGT